MPHSIAFTEVSPSIETPLQSIDAETQLVMFMDLGRYTVLEVELDAEGALMSSKVLRSSGWTFLTARQLPH